MARSRPTRSAGASGKSGKSASTTTLFDRASPAGSQGAAGGASGGAGGRKPKTYLDDPLSEEEGVSFLLFRDDPRKPHASARSADIEALNADPRLTQEFVPAIRL